MARSDARMKLLDASLTVALDHDGDMFGGNFKAWCAANGISRATAYRHRKRILEEGRWTEKSRRPSSSPHLTPARVEDEIVRLRADLGRDNGAETIAYHLREVAHEQNWKEQGWVVPSRATINNILRRRGLVVPQPRKRPKSSYRRFQYARPRDCYQIDATELALGTGEKVVVFEVLDDCTRTLVASIAAHRETAAGAIAAISAAFTDFGVPAIVLSDNGTAFTSRLTKGGTSRFTRHVTDAGARLIHSSPYHPQTCGKVERHHRTFKEWLTDLPAPTTMGELQHLCGRYQHFYNTERRHSAVDMPPHQAWKTAPTLGGPDHLPAQQDATIHSLTVSETGAISVGAVSVSIGRARKGQTVTVLADGDHVTAYERGGAVLGHLHLDHAKRYQGQLRPTA